MSNQQPIAYLSRELDVVSRGWPHCLRVIGAAALLAPEALKMVEWMNEWMKPYCTDFS